MRYIGNQLTNVKFDVDECCNYENFKLYKHYLESAILMNSDTIGTTYKTYFNNMKLFFKFLYEEEGNPYIADQNFLFRFSDVWERYCFHCLHLGNNKRTIANKRTACSSFFDWLVKRKYIVVNPFVYIDKLKITENDKRRKSYFLNSQEIWKIKYFLNEGEYTYKEGNTKKVLKFTLQDNLIFNMFLDSGARISEIHNLTLDQLDLSNMMFNDVKLKEGYIDSLIFFEDTQRILKDWLLYRSLNNIDSDYLLITNYKNRINQMSKETIRASIRKIGLIVGIKDFYPHSIRKTIINITAQTDESLASSFAHHSSLDVTRKHYVEKRKVNTIRSKMQSIREKAGI